MKSAAPEAITTKNADASIPEPDVSIRAKHHSQRTMSPMQAPNSANAKGGSKQFTLQWIFLVTTLAGIALAIERTYPHAGISLCIHGLMIAGARRAMPLGYTAAGIAGGLAGALGFGLLGMLGEIVGAAPGSVYWGGAGVTAALARVAFCGAGGFVYGFFIGQAAVLVEALLRRFRS